MQKQRDTTALVKAVSTVVREHVVRAVRSLTERLDGLEQRLTALPQPKDGKDGTDGTSVSLDDLRPVVKQAVDDAVLALPVPTNGIDGKDGVDGKSVAMEEVATLVREAVEQLPKPKDGVDGKDGENGVSVSLEDVIPLVREAVAQIPAPKDGKDGVDGKSITTAELLPTIKEWFDSLPRPKDGADGKSVTIDDISVLMETSIARWALDFERRANDHFQRCLDRMPEPKDGKDGKDGVDGLGFDDFEPTFDGRRTFKMRWSREDKVKEWAFKIPAVLEAGVYTHGKQYEQGDGVTCGGNYWIALVDTKARPGENNSDWRLAVRKGRDGKDGVVREGRAAAGASR